MKTSDEVVFMFTTVFPRQLHYALDPHNIATYPAADLTVEHIGDLINYDLPALLNAIRAGTTEHTEPRSS